MEYKLSVFHPVRFRFLTVTFFLFFFHLFVSRSYGRYYYRDKATGTIQWDFPEPDDDADAELPKKVPSRKAEGVLRPMTPPPPVISNGMVPPPPPVISVHDSRKRRISPAVENGDSGESNAARAPSLGALHFKQLQCHETNPN